MHVEPLNKYRLCLGPDGAPKRIIRNMPDSSQMIFDPQSQEVIEHIRDGHRYTKPEHETVTLIPSEPARVQAIQRLFAEYLQGLPARLLRDHLNQSGMRTVHGDIFTISTIHTILKNPAYTGTLMFNRRTNSKWHRYSGGRSVERHDEGLEARAREDWIVVENAWPTLVDKQVFEEVQAKLKDARERYQYVTGRASSGDYLLTGILHCGVCGGSLMGQTFKSCETTRNKRVIRRYVCGIHHKGDFDRCPTRYRIPADFAEQQVLSLIKEDLQHLKGDSQLHNYVQEEMTKLCGSQVNAKKVLQGRLSDIDGQIGKLTTHLSVLDAQTATTLGLYAKAKLLAEEREQVQSQLAAILAQVPDLPSPQEIAGKADEALVDLDKLIAGASLEEKRELIRTYVKGIKADPAKQEIEISILPALFSKIGTGG